MEPKIFILITCFCIAQVKPNKIPPPVSLGVEENIGIDRKIRGFAESVTLSDSKFFWGKPNFPNCFKGNKREKHNDAVVNFSYQTLEASNELSNGMPQFYKTRAGEVGNHVNSLGHTMKECKTKISEKVSENNFQEINEVMTEYKYKIEEELKRLYYKWYGITKTTNEASHLNPANKFEEKLKKEMTVVKKECDDIVNKIKECMEKKERKCP